MSKGSHQVMLRLDSNNRAMLDRLCEAYNNNQAVILRMAMKMLHERTFDTKVCTCECGKEKK